MHEIVLTSASSIATGFSSTSKHLPFDRIAILSKGKCLDVELNPVAIDEAEVRTISCTYDNLRVLNVYVVNGKSVGSDKYQHKLKWLKKLNNYCKSSLTEFKNFVVLGDFNIAPTDNDVFDIESVSYTHLRAHETR